VVAAANFNKLAEQQHLPWRAVARGVHPEESIPASLQNTLSAEGLNIGGWKPQLVADSDVRGAERVITLSCELPSSASVPGVTPVLWEVSADERGYPAAKSAIVDRVEELLKSLQAGDKR